MIKTLPSRISKLSNWKASARPTPRLSICTPPCSYTTSPTSSMDFLDHAMGQAMSSIDDIMMSSELLSPRRSSSSTAVAVAILSSSVPTAPLATEDNLELILQRWTRRLLTKRDYMHAHAASNVAFLLGGLALELITNAQWFFGDRLQPWYPTHGFEMVAMQAVIAVSAITGLGLTFSNRKGAERTVFAAYGVQVL